jgi:hypothetical protein
MIFRALRDRALLAPAPCSRLDLLAMRGMGVSERVDILIVIALPDSMETKRNIANVRLRCK